MAPIKLMENIGTNSEMKKGKTNIIKKPIQIKGPKNFKNINSKNNVKFDIHIDREQREEKEKENRKNIEKRKISKTNIENNSVFNRLTDNHQFLKKEKEMKLLDDLHNKHPCSFEPEINKISKLQEVNETIEDV